MLHTDRIAKMAEVKSPPRLVERVEPQLPNGTKPGQYEVVVSFVVSKLGVVRDIRVEKSSNPALTEPCIKAVTQWKFSPALSKSGQPVNMRLSIPFKIDVEEQQQQRDSVLPPNFRS
jgi:TonB family protein